jgi:hypothetical protein
MMGSYSQPAPPVVQPSATYRRVPSANRLHHITLVSTPSPDAMQDGPFNLSVDQLLAGSRAPPSSYASARLALRIKLTVPAMDDFANSNFQGFQSGIVITRGPETPLYPSHSSDSSSTSGGEAQPIYVRADCVTSVSINGEWQVQEVEPLQFGGTLRGCVPIGMAGDAPGGGVAVVLPESPLSRCRWLDPNSRVLITQQFVVDGATLAIVVYELERGNTPNALLTGLKRHKDSRDQLLQAHPPQGRSQPIPSYGVQSPALHASYYVPPPLMANPNGDTHFLYPVHEQQQQQQVASGQFWTSGSATYNFCAAPTQQFANAYLSDSPDSGIGASPSPFDPNASYRVPQTLIGIPNGDAHFL